jgi:hypothetical protein
MASMLAELSRPSVLVAIMLAGCNVYDWPTDDGGLSPDANAARDARPDLSRTDSSCSVIGRDACGAAGGAGLDGRAGGAAGQSGSGGTNTNDGSGGTAGASGGSGGTAGANDGGGGSAGVGAAGRPGDATGGAAGDASVDAGGGDAGGPTCQPDGGGASCRDAAIERDGGVVDMCPTDPLKTSPGICGCGTPDTDSDMDRTADCIDGCSADPAKTQPLLCGCNAVDPPDPDAGPAFCLKALLVHRYSFNGTGTAVTDSIGTAHGTVMGGTNATLSGGSLALSGDLGARYTNEGYAQLPPGLLDPLASATLEVWATWRGTGSAGNLVWQRIFDFGSQITSGTDLIGSTYLFLTPHATSSGFVRVAYTVNGSANETFVNGTGTFPLNVQTYIAVVIDDPNDTLTLYMNGAQAGTGTLTGTLTAIDNVNSWLGRSNYAVDPEFNGVLHEFRIYGVALTPAQIQTSYGAGPDPGF